MGTEVFLLASQQEEEGPETGDLVWRPQLCSLTGVSLSSSDLSFSFYGIKSWMTVTLNVLPPWTFQDFYSTVHLTVLPV